MEKLEKKSIFKSPVFDTMMLIAGLLMLMIFMGMISGCKTPAQQMSTLLKKNPDLLKTKTQIVLHHDTTFTKEIHKDSVINNIYSKDTIFLRENHLTIKYVYKGGDSAYLSGHVTRDTVIRIDTVRTVTNTVTVQQRTLLQDIKDYFFWFMLGLLVAIILIIILWKQINKAVGVGKDIENVIKKS